nr:phosphotransferase [Brevibacillus sp. SYP-B805]
MTQVCQRYKVRVIQITPHDDYYLLETNRGPKELRMWPRIDVMRWSFAWREQLARAGFREVERFIRTRDSKPFVVVGRKGFTMTDHLRGAEPFEPSPVHAETCGRMVGKMHEAQQANHLLDAAELLKKEQGFAVAEAKRARRLKKEFVLRHAFLSERDRWVASLFPPLLERMERSAELLTGTHADADSLAVSHRHMGKENWALVNDKVMLRGFFRPGLSVQLRDVAGYLKQLYADTEDTQRIDAFLDGYMAEKQLGYEDYKMLLAFMAFPHETWHSIEQYVCHASSEKDEQSPHGIEQALAAQERVDRLLLHIAHRAEETRGFVHEPL